MTIAIKDSAPLQHLKLKVTGMSCANCARAVERTLESVPGVDLAQVNLALEKADVRASNDNLQIESLVLALEHAGYGGSDWSKARLDDDADNRSFVLSDLWILLISAILTMPLVLPMLPIAFAPLSPLVQLALASPVQFWIGFRFYRGAWFSIRAALPIWMCSSHWERHLPLSLVS